MPTLLIIADDLTGAIDTGVKFAGKGRKITVFAGWKGDRKEALPMLSCDGDVIVANIDSRHDSPELAGRKVHAMMQWAGENKIPYIYKKTDATLRGNIGAELEAVAAESDTKTVIFIPAFPNAGRTVKDGMCYVNGVPLPDTHFARDPFNPVRHGRIRDVIGEQSRIAVIEYGKRSENTDEPLEPCVKVFDCESQRELEQLACELSGREEIRYAAGCSAFAGVLEHWYDWEKNGVVEADNDAQTEDALPILVICGSVNETTLCQLRFAEDVLGYQALTLTPEQKLIEDLSNENSSLFREAAGFLEKSRKLIIRAVDGQADMERTDKLCRQLSLDPNSLPLVIADHIGRLTAHLLRMAPVRTVVLFGGDTLAAVIQHLGVRRIELIGEVLPGVVDTCMISDDGCWRIVTKSGALGERNMMQSLERYLLGAKNTGEGK